MSLISIITPTYNGGKYLAQTIASVQRQTFRDYEHIIIDNSPEKTEKPNGVIYISNKQNRGIANSRNQGIQLAKGKYFVFLDHDDVFLTRDHLQKLFDFLETHPDYGIVASYIINIDEHGKELHRNFGRISDEEIRSHLLQACQFTPCSMMIRKEAVQERGGFDKRYDRVDDYDLRMKIGRMRKMQMLPEYTAGYRIHTTNTSKSLKSQYQMKWLAWKVFWKNRNYYPNFRSALVLRICKFIIPSSTASFLVRLLRK